MNALEVLNRLGGGHAPDKLAAAILRVAEEVRATGNTGKVTLTLSVSQPPGGDPALVTVQDSIGVTLPKDDSSLGAFFFAVDGELHTRDPRHPRCHPRRVTREEHRGVLRVLGRE